MFNLFKKIKNFISFFFMVFLAIACKPVTKSAEDIEYEKEEAKIAQLVKTILSTDEIENAWQADQVRLYADGQYGWEIEGATLERRLFLLKLVNDYLQQHKNEIGEDYTSYYINYAESKIYLLERVDEENPSAKSSQTVIDESMAFIRFIKENQPDKLGENNGYIDGIAYRLLDMGKKVQAYRLVSDYYQKVAWFEHPEFFEDNERDLAKWLKKQSRSNVLPTPEQAANRNTFFAKQKQQLITQKPSKVIYLTPNNYQHIVTDENLKAQLLEWVNNDRAIHYVKGDVYIEGDFSQNVQNNLFGDNPSQKMPLYIIDGNLIVNGVVNDAVINGALFISGSLVAQTILHENSLFEISGDLIANALIYGEYNDGSLQVYGKTRAPVIYSYDHDMPSGNNAFYSAHMNPNSAAMGFADKTLGELLNMHSLLFRFDEIKAQIKNGGYIVKPQYWLSEVTAANQTLPTVDMDFQ